ncbi:MAG: hypothetical protein AAF578_04040 [Pseudomonadota bacterium]
MDNNTTPLPGYWLALVRCSGKDRLSFLQGQLTQDVEALDAEHIALPAACCDPKGRVIATMTLVWQPEEIVMIMHHEVAEALVEHLLKYRLRADVKLDLHPTLSVTAALAQNTGHEVAMWRKDTNGWRVGVLHEELIAISDQHRHICVANERWQQLRMAAGVLDLPLASSTQYTPHMLNLDQIGAISFSKGCYTGQEIVARTEHRGQVKRRASLMRVRTDKHLGVSAGQTVLADGNKIGTVVCGAGHVLSAVCNPVPDGSNLTLDDGRDLVQLD